MPPLFLYPLPKGTHHALHVCTMLDYRLMHLELTFPFMSYYSLLSSLTLTHFHTLILSYTLSPLRRNKTTHIESWDKERTGMEKGSGFLQTHHQKNYALVGRKSSSLTCVQKEGKEGKRKTKHIWKKDVIFIYLYIYGTMFFISPLSVLALFCFSFFLISTQIHTQTDTPRRANISSLYCCCTTLFF